MAALKHGDSELGKWVIDDEMQCLKPAPHRVCPQSVEPRAAAMHRACVLLPNRELVLDAELRVALDTEASDLPGGHQVMEHHVHAALIVRRQAKRQTGQEC